MLSDELNHASIIDGIRLCKAHKLRYGHLDMADLEAKLQETQVGQGDWLKWEGPEARGQLLAPRDQKALELTQRAFSGSCWDCGSGEEPGGGCFRLPVPGLGRSCGPSTPGEQGSASMCLHAGMGAPRALDSAKGGVRTPDTVPTQHPNFLQKHRLRLVATDGIFSMDGDLAPLREICRLASRYGALVFVDDCHATGFLGATGRWARTAPTGGDRL